MEDGADDLSDGGDISIDTYEEEDITTRSSSFTADQLSIASGSTQYTFCTVEDLSTIYEQGESQCSSNSINAEIASHHRHEPEEVGF